jgi:pimeloyl-ACP methyl ester carboxylesterase
MFRHPAGLALLLSIIGSRSFAQPATAQDSTLDNLVHAPEYVTSTPGTLGVVIQRGKGPVDMVLVTGFGLGASAFDGFMRRNVDRYRMYAVTLPGFEGTPAPPMPATGTSYGDQTWTRSAADAVVTLIRTKKLRRPVLVGHFINGSQVAMRVAIEHPELVRALVLLAGTPRYEPVVGTKYWPKDMTLEQKVRGVDQFLAPRWFKTVTRETWVSNNFRATDYSIDSTLGGRFAASANEPTLPVLIRYLCEYHASDLWPDLERLTLPLLVVKPAFTATLRADTTRSYLQSFFQEPWRGKLEGRARAEIVNVEDAGILIMDDQPAIVDRTIMAFVKRLGK